MSPGLHPKQSKWRIWKESLVWGTRFMATDVRSENRICDGNRFYMGITFWQQQWELGIRVGGQL